LCNKIPAAITLYQRAGNGRPNEGTQSDNRKTLSIARSNLCHIRRQRCHGGRKDALEASNKEAIAHRPGIESRLTGDERPEEEDECGDEAKRNKDIVRSGILVRKEGRNEATEDTDAIEHEKDINTSAIGQAEDVDGKRRNVVKRKVLAQGNQKYTEQEDGIRNLPKCRDFKHGTRFPRRQPGLQQRTITRAHAQHDEAHDAHRPCKPNPGQQLPRQRRIHEPTRRTPGRHDGQGNAAVAVKVGAHEAEGRRELHAVSHADEHALGEEKLPVRPAQTRQKDAQRRQQHAGHEAPVEEAGVKGAARQHAQAEVAEHLETADPGYGRGFEAELRGVVLLEDAKAGYHPPRIEDYKVPHEGLRPCG